MTRRPKLDLPPEKWVLIGTVAAIGIGVQIARELGKSPSERAEERRRNADRFALRREYEARLQEAWNVDAARWRQFEEDPEARAAISAERHVTINAEPADAQVTFRTSSNFGHRKDWVTATSGDETLVVHVDYDGGAWITYSSGTAHYHSKFGSTDGYVTVGESEGPVTADQVRAASLLGAMQLKGHFPGIISIVRPWSFERIKRHFAAYARAHGWPEERHGEDRRVRRAYRSLF